MTTTVFKPAGIPVFAPHHDPQGDCVLRRLGPYQADRWPPGFEAGLAHRLDISTSGALLRADTPAELAELRAYFSERRLIKRYCFVSARDVSWSHNRCERRIAHDKRRKRRMVVERGASTPHRGRWYPADTTFERLAGNLWQATITTGVMHQIRVHAAFVGLPLLGDRLYGGGHTPDDAPAGMQFFLHHIGLRSRDGRIETQPVPTPAWARSSDDSPA